MFGFRRRSRATLAAASIFTALLGSAQVKAQAAPAGGVDAFYAARDRIWSAAFDPAKLFTGRFTPKPAVTISYTGDEGWPVYAIAIARGCLGDERNSTNCGEQRIARMVRAPAVADSDRPRRRGAALVRQLLGAEAMTPAELARKLDEAGLEWLQADLGTCPAAEVELAKATTLSWVSDNLAASSAPEPIFLHADVMKVEFGGNLRRATYWGYIADDSPAAWAVALAAALETCWRPATSLPPWRR